MLWPNSQDKPQLSIHLYSPQITVINGSRSNLLVGYVTLALGRPTSIKSLRVSLSGIYSAYWVDGTGQSRQEYYQNKRFHQDTCVLTRRNLRSVGSRHVQVAGAESFATRSRSSSTSSECTVGGERYYDDEVYSASNPVTPTSLSPPHPYARAAGNTQQQQQQSHNQSQRQRREEHRMRSNSIGDDETLGFELAPGTHIFDFCLPLPPKMPSTVMSEVGGIAYTLSAHLKTRSALGRLAGTHQRASCPVQVVNLPSRFAHMQADVPMSDEAVVTKQAEAGWWVMARLSARTASPGDMLRLNVFLSWPDRIAYEEDPARVLRVVAVRMDLFEATVYRSLTTGGVIKSIEACIASNAENMQGSRQHSVVGTPQGSRQYSIVGTPQGSRQNSTMDLLSLAITPMSEKPSRSSSPASSESSRHPRGMFNEQFAYTSELCVPQQRAGGKAGVHVDCRSAPLSVVHEVRVSVRVYDATSGRTQ
ncbi:hypothetical protein IW150_005616, partial [Coemansia sp. RSA 2607]